MRIANIAKKHCLELTALAENIKNIKRECYNMEKGDLAMEKAEKDGQTSYPERIRTGEEILRGDVFNLVVQTRINACNKHGKKYSTHHEAYAVMCEEYEEVILEMNILAAQIRTMWDNIKQDSVDSEEYWTLIDDIRIKSILMAAEAIHVGAVADKLLGGVIYPPKN